MYEEDLREMEKKRESSDTSKSSRKKKKKKKKSCWNKRGGVGRKRRRRAGAMPASSSSSSSSSSFSEQSPCETLIKRTSRNGGPKLVSAFNNLLWQGDQGRRCASCSCVPFSFSFSFWPASFDDPRAADELCCPKPQKERSASLPSSSCSLSSLSLSLRRNYERPPFSYSSYSSSSSYLPLVCPPNRSIEPSLFVSAAAGPLFPSCLRLVVIAAAVNVGGSHPWFDLLHCRCKKEHPELSSSFFFLLSPPITFCREEASASPFFASQHKLQLVHYYYYSYSYSYNY